MHFPAYFLTWTTYGTWLHGDVRGSVNQTQNAPGSLFLPPDHNQVAYFSQKQAAAQFLLSDEMRPIVDQSIRDHSLRRIWQLLALNVRTNHVHLIVNCADSYTPEIVMQQLKSWATRRLIAADLVRRGARIWTDHGSTRYLNDHPSLERAVNYVLHGQYELPRIKVH
ncbi:MAG TPA: transposase [Phycisphaerales bacterium]|nr:transposase [Phycisphaerales bacterium]